jgi:hypothetical protein
MRRLSFDQYEFETVDSEESLELVISSPERHPDLRQFLVDCGAQHRQGVAPGPDWTSWSKVAEHLRCFAGVELPHVGHWREIWVLHDDCDDLEVALSAGSWVIWYHWSTSA